PGGRGGVSGLRHAFDRAGPVARASCRTGSEARRGIRGEPGQGGVPVRGQKRSLADSGRPTGGGATGPAGGGPGVAQPALGRSRPLAQTVAKHQHAGGVGAGQMGDSALSRLVNPVGPRYSRPMLARIAALAAGIAWIGTAGAEVVLLK